MAEEYKIIKGLPEKFHDQLIAYTNAPEEYEVREDGDGERFCNKEALNEWLKKGRTCYVVTDPEEKELLGLYWFGKKELPENFTYTEKLDPKKYGYTNALRLYGRLRGIGLGRQIYNEVTRMFMQSPDYDGTGMWGLTKSGVTLKVCAPSGMYPVTIPAIDTSIKTDPRTNPEVIFIATDEELKKALF